MNQGRKDSSYESSARIAFWSIVLLIVITLFLSIKTNAQKVAYTDVPGVSAWHTHWIRQDKAMHVFSCASLSILTTQTAYDLHAKNPEVVGIGVALGIGIGKEFLMDRTPDAYDLTANIVGALAGVYLNRWLQRVEMKYYKKK